MTTVIVPWRPGCAHRERAWAALMPRYQWPVIEAPGGEPWIKAHAVMPAIAALPAGEVAIVADADVWCDEVDLAVRAVELGATWAIPHLTVHRLTEQSTAAVLGGADWTGQPLEQRAYRGVEGGGIIVARRERLLEAPLDPRFVGWGQEDESWAFALSALHGPAWRGTAPLVHLWHPPQPRLTRRRGSVDGWQLRRRYARARHDPAVMRALIQEADALHSHQPAVHDHPPPALGRRG